MPELLIRDFTGIDVSAGRLDKDMRSCRDAKNLALDAGRRWNLRPAIRLYTKVHPQSVGLFAANGQLQALVPAGNGNGNGGYKQFQPPEVNYNPIGLSTDEAFPDRVLDVFGNVTAGMKRLNAATTFDVDALGGGIPYVSVEMASGQNFHHYLDQDISDPTANIATVVQLNFIAGKPLAKLAGKIFAPSVEGAVHGCKTLLPREWNITDNPLIEDAVRLDVNQNAEGDRTVTSITHHNGRLVVFFENSTQVWNISPDPALNSLAQALQGPGTSASSTIVNVLSDVFFFSDGGFRGLRTTTIEQELREGQIGDPIRPLTEAEIVTEENTVALWSQSRGEYLCAINRGDSARIYVLRYSPERRLMDWSYWEIDITIDYMVELDGSIYFRSGDDIYYFEDQWTKDFGTVEIPTRWESQVYGSKNIGAAKHWLQYDQTGTGKTKVYAVYDTDQDDPDLLGFFDGDTLNDGFRAIGERSQTLQIIHEGSKGPRSLESIELVYKMSKARAR